MALIAFEHPLSEVQMRAVIALGWKSEKAAERTLVDCALRQPRQYIPHDKRETVRRLICGKFSAAFHNASVTDNKNVLAGQSLSVTCQLRDDRRHDRLAPRDLG
ncbi:MAG TPA: hypothetical protein VNY06_07895 [Methylocella sp.]|nr:hypothetical protein [Methylocella sp.]